MRVEHIGDATLYLGDCLDIFPEIKEVTAFVTDPPFGIEGGKGGDSRSYGKGKYDGEFFDDKDYVDRVCVTAIYACIDISEAGSLTPGNRCAHLYPPPADVGCFWHPAAVGHGPWGMNTFNQILYYGKDWRAGRGALPSGKLVTEVAEKNGHPCPKPIGAWRWLVDKTCRPGGSVLDPFMGSGTTGVACAQLGRKFIGIEIEPRYFDIACRRIEQAYAQGKLFNPKPVQDDYEQVTLFERGEA